MVVRHGDVWDTFVSMENLRLGFNDAIRGRHRNKQVQKILSKQKYDIIGKKRKGETREQYLIRKEKKDYKISKALTIYAKYRTIQNK